MKVGVNDLKSESTKNVGHFNHVVVEEDESDKISTT
jgi:hypothetical protein